MHQKRGNGSRGGTSQDLPAGRVREGEQANRQQSGTQQPSGAEEKRLGWDWNLCFSSCKMCFLIFKNLKIRYVVNRREVLIGSVYFIQQGRRSANLSSGRQSPTTRACLQQSAVVSRTTSCAGSSESWWQLWPSGWASINQTCAVSSTTTCPRWEQMLITKLLLLCHRAQNKASFHLHYFEVKTLKNVLSGRVF